MTEKTYTTFQAADICNVYPSTVIKWAKEGKIKVFATPGGHRRILASDLVYFLKRYRFPIPQNLSFARRRVLLAEDEQDVGNLLKKALLREAPDVEVQWIQDGIEALLAIGNSPPDLLILDVVMPVIDGARVLATLRANPKTRKLRVIGITGKRLSQEKLRFMQSHTEAFFLKPFEISEFVRKAMRLLGVPRRS
ncbi:MAG: response regulator [Elusimicrobia bacterium]|nr:response regulator [Elusimicrobiota bacterium]